MLTPFIYNSVFPSGEHDGKESVPVLETDLVDEKSVFDMINIPDLIYAISSPACENDNPVMFVAGIGSVIAELFRSKYVYMEPTLSMPAIVSALTDLIRDAFTF